MNFKNISIAVMGTTSAGKSSFVNTLCGRNVLPVGVQETTRYITEIVHKPKNIIISIENKALSFEKRFFNSDSEARDYIKSLVSTFQDSPTKFHILTRNRVELAFLSEFLSLFDCIDRHHDCHKINLKLVDLPGYNHKDDETNWHIISNGIDHSIIFFLFNAEENDFVKEDELLERIFRYLRDEEISWKNMIFIVNRCDALLRDSDGRSAVAEKISNIRKRIAMLIGDIYRIGDDQVQSQIQVYPLATLPVMYAEILYWNFNKLTKAEKEDMISRSCQLTNEFVSDEVCDFFPRSPQKWDEKHIQLYRENVFENSFFSDFLSSLKSHIYTRLAAERYGNYLRESENTVIPI